MPLPGSSPYEAKGSASGWVPAGAPIHLPTTATMMLLSYQELVNDIVEKGVITGVPTHDNINGSSIDITLGRELLIEDVPPLTCPSCGNEHAVQNRKEFRDRSRWLEHSYCLHCGYGGALHTFVIPIDIEKKQPLRMQKHDCTNGFVLWPGEVCLAHSVEIFNLPHDITAEYRLKSSMGRVFLEHLHAGWCFAGDTKVALLNGEHVPIADLVGQSPWIYALDEFGEVVPAQATDIRATRRVDILTRVTLDNNESFTCTSDHRVMVRDGSYVEAGRLAPGQAVMPFYTRDGQYGHQEVYSPSTVLKSNWRNPRGRWRKTHALVDEHLNGTLPRGMVVHHVDENRRNNSPDNLTRMDAREHFQLHTSERNRSPEMRLAASDRMSRRNVEAWQDPTQRKAWTERNRANAMATNEKRWGYMNHKVAMVETVQTDSQTVYDLTIPKYHNFALTSGVFVHNCDPGWHGSVLTLEFKNMNNYHPIRLRAGMKCGQVMFYRHKPVPDDASYAVRGQYNKDTTATASKGVK